MRVFNRDQRAKLLGAVTERYLSEFEQDDMILGAPEPDPRGAGAWYPVKLFMRYDLAGIDTIDDIVRGFYRQWRDTVHQDLAMNGAQTVDSVADFIRALDDAGMGQEE